MENLTIHGEVLATSQEATLAVELFLQDNYLFRRNVLNGKVEFATLPAETPQYRTLTQESLNSIIIRAKREDVCEKGNPRGDIMELIRSEEVPAFNPVQDFLEHLPEWDGRNHVAQLFSRIPGISTEQHGFLAIWLRSTVAH
ncbi:MAG: helicase, partial [Prevotella sp.]|nr:helicase [Prevotella sp.]